MSRPFMRSAGAARAAGILMLALALGACSTAGTHSAYVSSNEPRSWFGKDLANPLKEGKSNFRRQNFGLAEQNFRKAVETDPRNAEAWLGLAASYDQLGRFDHADRAYEELIRITGPLPQILNNRGYSYYLRGDTKKARAVLNRAAQADPENTRIQGNLDLLNQG